MKERGSSSMATLTIEPNAAVTLRIAYEDELFVVVEKPAGLVTQPGLGHERDTLLNGLFSRYGATLQNLGKDRDFGLLHRLDREASGLLIVPLRAGAYDALRAQFVSRGVRKFYWAVVGASPKAAQGVIRKPIDEYTSTVRGGRHGKKLARVSSAGKPAVTAYRVIEASPLGALLECRAATGRLHQVRVHLASIKCPIIGDGLYGGEHTGARMALHAHRLVFKHPVSGEEIDVRSKYPNDLKGVLRRLKLKTPTILDRSDAS